MDEKSFKIYNLKDINLNFCENIENWRNKVWFEEAIENIPQTEIDYLEKYLKVNELFVNKTQRELAEMLALTRLSNPMCHNPKCHSKQNTSSFMLCSECHLVWYCDGICKKRDLENHSEWCCIKDAPLDNEQFLPVIVKK